MSYLLHWPTSYAAKFKETFGTNIEMVVVVSFQVVLQALVEKQCDHLAGLDVKDT